MANTPMTTTSQSGILISSINTDDDPNDWNAWWEKNPPPSITSITIIRGADKVVLNLQTCPKGFKKNGCVNCSNIGKDLIKGLKELKIPAKDIAHGKIAVLEDNEAVFKPNLYSNYSYYHTKLKAFAEYYNKNNPFHIKFIFSIDVKEDVVEPANLEVCRLIDSGKHQIILHGAPGTGKTFTAQQIAQLFVQGQVDVNNGSNADEKRQNPMELGPINRFYKKYLKNPKLQEELEDSVTKLLYDQSPIVKKDNNNFADNYIPKKNQEKIVKVVQEEEPNYAQTDLLNDLWNMQGRLALVQFHPSYDYTDFVEGLRPIKPEDGNLSFARMDGSFMRFCRFVQWRNELWKKESENTDKNDSELPKYFFIIDEINRADLSKVLGELMYGLEEDKRGKPIVTQYSNLETWFDPKQKFPDDYKNCFNATEQGRSGGFRIPPNVVVIGTMNDIDRSVESMDFALRRRFVWQRIEVTQPFLYKAFVDGGFFNTLDLADNEKKEAVSRKLAKAIVDFNKELREIPGFGSGDYDIAQGQFTGLKRDNLSAQRIRDSNGVTSIMEWVWEYRVESLLREYLRGNAKQESYMKQLEKSWNDSSRNADEQKKNISSAVESFLPEYAKNKVCKIYITKRVVGYCAQLNNALLKENVDAQVGGEIFKGIDTNKVFLKPSEDESHNFTKEKAEKVVSRILEYVWEHRLEGLLRYLLRNHSEYSDNEENTLNKLKDSFTGALDKDFEEGETDKEVNKA